MVRHKHRYFVTEIEVKGRPSHAPLKVNNYQMRESILKKIHQVHGDFGLAAVKKGFHIKYCNPYTKILLIRGRHGPHRFIGTVLPLIKLIENLKVQLNILHVGSTMMKCFKFIRNHQLATLEKYWNKMKTDKSRMQLKEAILDIKISKEIDSQL